VRQYWLQCGLCIEIEMPSCVQHDSTCCPASTVLADCPYCLPALWSLAFTNTSSVTTPRNSTPVTQCDHSSPASDEGNLC
jgi:hypothetical protein